MEVLGLTDLKPGEFRKIYDEFGLFAVCHYVDPNEYEKFNEVAQSTVSHRFAKLMKQTQLDNNTFANKISNSLLLPDKLKPNHLLFCLHGESGMSVRIMATQDYSEYYVLQDYGRNTRLRYCIDKKNVTPVVRYNNLWKDTLMELYQANKLKFESNTIYFYFKNIMKIN